MLALSAILDTARRLQCDSNAGIGVMAVSLYLFSGGFYMHMVEGVPFPSTPGAQGAAEVPLIAMHD